MHHNRHTIRIAIAGKRDHTALGTTALHGAIEELIDSIARLSTTTLPARVQFLSGLADGSDQIITKKILDKKGVPSFYVDAVLPFTPTFYRDHPVHTLKHKATFDDLLKKCDRVICVNNEEVSKQFCQVNNADAILAAERAFEAQALLMLKRSDILFVLADPSQPIVKAGTLHTVNKARVHRIPVFFISLADSKLYVFDDETNLYDTAADIIKEQQGINQQIKMEAVLKRVIDNQRILDAYGKESVHLDLLFGSDGTFIGRYTWMERRRDDIWNSINKKLKEMITGEKVIQASEMEIKKCAQSDKPKQQDHPIVHKFKIIEKINSFYANQYRGGFIFNNRLTILAVTIALISLLIILFGLRLPMPWEKEPESSENNYEWLHDAFTVILLSLAVGKFIVLILIDRNSKQGQRRNWNERSIQTRYLAERLRVFEHLFYNGILKGIKPSLGKHLNPNFHGTAPEATYRRFEGEVSLISDKFVAPDLIALDPIESLKKLNNDLIKDQISYHTNTSKKMKELEHFLEHFGKNLNFTTIILVAIDFTILLLSLLVKKHCQEECFPFIHWLHILATPIFIAITAFFPVVVAGTNAVRFQSEAKKLKERYATMRDLLQDKHDKIEDAIAKSSKYGSQILEFYPLIAEVEQIMLDEVSDWGLLYSKEFVET